MARSPAYRPTFPEEFVQQAEFEARRKIGSHRSVQRSQLVLRLRQHPEWGEEELGRRVGRSGRQVRRWCKRWAGGDWSLADTSGRGRKADFPPPGSRGGQGRGVRTRGRNQPAD